MKKVQFIIKVTNACNLRCKYCYNAAKHFKEGVIPLERFEKAISMFSDFDVIQVIFHGGEPMLGGLPFYKKAMEIEELFTAKKGIQFENLIQTNATLIDKEWIAFFKKHKFTVGVSFDGLENEKYRGETDKVLKSIALLHKEGMRVGGIAVVASPDYDIGANYDYFKSLGVSADFSIVFNEGSAKDMALMSIEDYTRQMLNLFDRWIYDVKGVNVRPFAFMLRKAMHCCKEYCGNGSCIGNFFCFDVDGSVYGCSHETVKKYRFGSLDEFQTHHDIINSPNFKAYLLGSIERRKACQATCSYYDYCKGGCVDDAILAGDISKPNPAYCYYFRALFDKVKSTVDEIFEKKIPLDQLNPVFKKILAESMMSK